MGANVWSEVCGTGGRGGAPLHGGKRMGQGQLGHSWTPLGPGPKAGAGGSDCSVPPPFMALEGAGWTLGLACIQAVVAAELLWL